MRILIEEWRDRLPDLVKQMEKRPLFCDWLLQTGIFGWSVLDDLHRDLYNRIRSQYEERRHALRISGVDPECETVQSKGFQPDDAEQISLLPFRYDLNLMPKMTCDLLSESLVE